jgi:tripartite-type tricarboxylate transporter receptor subunit TctC
MQPDRRFPMNAARIFVLMCAGWSAATATVAADYPDRPVRMIVPFAPGGFTDVVSRIVAQQLTDIWNKTVVVDNRPGAGGTIGPAIASKAAADGYTLLLGSNSTFSVNPAVYKQLPYDVFRDLDLVGLVAFSAHVVVVRADIQANTIGELVALAKKQPRKYTFASSGAGAAIHMAGELFGYQAGIQLLHVPYKGGGPAAVAMLAGEVDMMVNDPGPLLPHIKSGKLRALAVANRQRSALLPDLPTVAEAGVAGVESSSWAGIAVPRHTPPAVVKTISNATTRILGSPEYKTRLTGLGMEPLVMTPAETNAFIKSELDKWTKIARLAQVQLE